MMLFSNLDENYGPIFGPMPISGLLIGMISFEKRVIVSLYFIRLAICNRYIYNSCNSIPGL